MSEIAKLTHESLGEVELFRIVGEVDASNAQDLSGRLLDALTNESRAVVVDFTNTTYIDSSGVSLIFEVASDVQARRQELRLVVVPRSFVAEVLAAVSIHHSVPVDPVLDDALAALRPG